MENKREIKKECEEKDSTQNLRKKRGMSQKECREELFFVQ